MSNGLWAYSYDGSSFTNTAHISKRRANGVEVGSDGTVFLVGGVLSAYDYSPVEPTGVEFSDIVPEYANVQNYPNPFSETTTFQFVLAAPGHVKLEVFDLLGRKVASLVDGEFVAGAHQKVFDVNGLTAGTYLYRIRAGEFVQTKKIAIVR